MKHHIITLLTITLFISFTSCSTNQSTELKSTTLFQHSTLSALLEGVYDGDLTVAQLKKQGNYGIGTFNALDGEMVLMDGVCYKVQSDSKVSVVSDLEQTPFAAVCDFKPDTVVQIHRASTLKEVQNEIDSLVPSANLIYAYKITGNFDSIVIRSVPKQEKPYLRLIEAYKKQGVYTFVKGDGMLFGYKFPKYLKDVNMDGYHFHYISTDKTKGGHLLNCKIVNAQVEIAYIRNYQLQLPNSAYFNATELSNKKSELRAIEGGEDEKK